MNNKTILSSNKEIHKTLQKKKVFLSHNMGLFNYYFQNKKVERRFVSYFIGSKIKASYCKSANHRLFSAAQMI